MVSDRVPCPPDGYFEWDNVFTSLGLFAQRWKQDKNLELYLNNCGYPFKCNVMPFTAKIAVKLGKRKLCKV